jgi:hypothetical protein
MSGAIHGFLRTQNVPTWWGGQKSVTRVNLNTVVGPILSIKARALNSGESADKLGYFTKKAWIPVTIFNQDTHRSETILLKKSNLIRTLTQQGFSKETIDGILEHPENLTSILTDLYANKFSEKFFHTTSNATIKNIFQTLISQEEAPPFITIDARIFKLDDAKAWTEHTFDDIQSELAQRINSFLLHDRIDDLSLEPLALSAPNLKKKTPPEVKKTSSLTPPAAPSKPIPNVSHVEVEAAAVKASEGPGIPGQPSAQDKYERALSNFLNEIGIPTQASIAAAKITLPPVERFDLLSLEKDKQVYRVDFGSNYKLETSYKVNFMLNLSITLTFESPLTLTFDETRERIDFEPNKVKAQALGQTQYLSNVSFGTVEKPFHLETASAGLDLNLEELTKILGKPYQRI